MGKFNNIHRKLKTAYLITENATKDKVLRYMIAIYFYNELKALSILLIIVGDINRFLYIRMHLGNMNKLWQWGLPGLYSFQITLHEIIYQTWWQRSSLLTNILTIGIKIKETCFRRHHFLVCRITVFLVMTSLSDSYFWQL